ncbi:MAG TPA: hypothetical protein VM327_04735 [Candidatus Thermoplasmatota archaeon]|nr:hypothetical protein [Candidatus Thermoplasmatota archaeon]
MRLFVATALLLLGFAAVPNTQATAFQQTILDCGTFTANYDGGSDSDTWSYCATPQCGCMCPYVGAAVVVEAAGQERGAFVVASCQSGYGTTSGPADDGSPVVVVPIVGGGGLGNIGSIIAFP